MAQAETASTLMLYEAMLSASTHWCLCHADMMGCVCTEPCKMPLCHPRLHAGDTSAWRNRDRAGKVSEELATQGVGVCWALHAMHAG